MQKIPFFIALYFSSALCFGQHDLDTLAGTALERKLNMEVSMHLSKTSDTTIIFYDRSYTAWSEPEIYPIGKVNVLEVAYLISKTNNISYIEKNVSYFTETGGGIIKSRPIDITSDILYDSLKLLLPKIDKEQFLPNIYEFEKNGIKCFGIGYATHTPSYEIRLQGNKYYSSKNVEWIDLQEKTITDAPTNLNFKFNSSLSLFRFYTLISDMIKSMENKFRFK